MALGGLFPGLVSTRSIANLGTYEIEVTITPVHDYGGGGGGWLRDKHKYNVKIKITRNGKVWEYESTVNKGVAKVIAKVMKTTLVEPEIFVTSTSVSIEPIIKVTKK